MLTLVEVARETGRARPARYYVIKLHSDATNAVDTRAPIR